MVAAICLGVMVLLNVISNLVRILVLVQFSILPQMLAHEEVGLACLLLYVILPATFGAKCIIQKKGTDSGCAFKVACSNKLKPGFHFLLLLAILVTSFKIRQTDTYGVFEKMSAVKVAGYKTAMYSPGIIKLEHNKALIYVKFIRGFYDSVYNPSICWKGSGYQFQQTSQQQTGGHTIFTSLLVNGSDKLYTA